MAFTLVCQLSFSQPAPGIYTELERSYESLDFEACIKLQKQVEALARTQRDTVVANSFFYVGDAHYQLGETAEAIRWLERERSLRAELGLMETEAFSGSLYNLASLYLEEGNYSKAGEMADQLIINDRKLYGAASEEFVSSVVSTIDIFARLEKFSDAEKLLQSTVRQQPRNSLSQGVLLSKLGDLYTLTSQYSKAARSLESALAILAETAGQNSPEYITVLVNVGILNMGRGKFAEAEETFDYALAEISPDQPGYLATLNNQGLVYRSLGQLQRAEKIFLDMKAMDSIDLGVTHPDFAITLTNLGFVYAEEGKFILAERALLRALEIQRNNGEEKTASYARKLNNLARVYRLAGTPEKAIPLHEQALKLFRKTLGDRSAETATTLYNTGVAYWKAGDERAALKYLRNSASVRASTLGKEHPKYNESREKIAEYLWYRKQMKEAREIFGEVFRNYYYQMDAWFPVLTEEEKAKLYYTNIKPAFEKFNSFAMDLRETDPTILGEVYNHQVNTKASIMYATEKVKEAIQSSGDTLLISEFEMWQAQKEQIAKLYSQNLPNNRIDSLQQSADRLEKELTRKSAVFAKQFTRRKLTWTDVQKTLNEKEAAIEVIRYNTYSPDSGGAFSDKINYAFLIVTTETRNQPDLVLLDNGNEMESKFLNFYRNNIRFAMDDTRSYANYAGALVEYLAAHGVGKVFLSPDGVYNQISINTLKDPKTGGFLVDNFDIRLVTNTRELVNQKSVRSGSQSSILIGYPKFNLKGPSQSKGTATRSLTRGGITRGLRGGLLRYMRGEGGISVLPGTQEEIKRIATLSADPKTFMEEMASEDVVKKVNGPMILHLATHGYFLEDEAPAANTTSTYVPNPLLRSGLILAGAENFLKTGTPVNERGDDGILTAYEAMNLNLDDTDLVVLSACETGLGVVKNGEGVYGLQRAFKMAGAKSMIMSLWSVDDEATQELMSLFYSERLTNSDQHAAFRTAQQKLKEKYNHPFYWGAFVMVGI